MDFDPTDVTNGPPQPNLLEPGRYRLRVREAEERMSSKGNPMIVLELEASGRPGIIIREYLVATKAAMYKIKDFAEAAGLGEKFRNGRITEDDCRSVIVDADVYIEEGDGYPDKNRVETFHPAEPSSTERAMAGQQPQPAAAPAGGGPHQGIPEDDIPF